jgi:hypothetical protein
MGLAALTVDEMISGFPNPDLPLVTTKPKFEDNMITQKLLNAKYISIPSLAGGGRHSHLGLIMTVQEYEAISAIPFGAAVNPGPIAQVVCAFLQLRPTVTRHAKDRSCILCQHVH